MIRLQNHTFQAEAGAIFDLLKPRLAVATHLRVTPYSITPILSAIRSRYQGPLAIATDFDVWDITSKAVVQRRFLPVDEHSGYEFNEHPQEYVLANSDVPTEPRPAVVDGNLTVFRISADVSRDKCKAQQPSSVLA